MRLGGKVWISFDIIWLLLITANTHHKCIKSFFFLIIDRGKERFTGERRSSKKRAALHEIWIYVQDSISPYLVSCTPPGKFYTVFCPSHL